MKKHAGILCIRDAFFLFGAVFASALPYVSGLGFYLDDWSYNRLLAQASPRSLMAMFRTLLRSDEDIRLRPVQAAYYVLRYKAFGLHPLPWHIADQVVLGLAVVAFYVVMREVLQDRSLAFVVALVFGLLPHYSTDRIWTTMGAGLSTLFAYVGLFALARSVMRKNSRPLLWLILAMAALALSILSYEVEFGLIAASILVAGWWVYRSDQTSGGRAWGRRAGVASLGAGLLAIVLAKARAETRVEYHHHFFSRLRGLLGHAVLQTVRFNVWTYILHMPVVLAGLYHHSAFSRSAIGIAVLLTCATAAYLWRAPGLSAIPPPATCLWLLVAGFILFALGFGLFLSNANIDFATMGADNRVAIASAAGAACVLVALAGLLCAALRPSVRAGAYSVMIALICGVNCLVMSGIGHFWVDAAQRQQAVVQSVRANAPVLPHGAVLLLDGICRYLGPASVLDGEYDTTGVIQLAYGDPSLDSNLVTPKMHFGAAEVTTMYGDLTSSYPYGKELFVYNVLRKKLTILTSPAVAAGYLRAMHPAGDNGCPPAIDGEGVRVY